MSRKPADLEAATRADADHLLKYTASHGWDYVKTHLIAIQYTNDALRCALVLCGMRAPGRWTRTVLVAQLGKILENNP